MRRAQRCRAVKKTRRVLPGGKTVYHFRKKKTAKHTCPCGAKLNRPAMRIIKLRKLPKVQRRSNRALPNLCPTCARETLRKQARSV
jgi:large subunit ribosomal protein L34e